MNLLEAQNQTRSTPVRIGIVGCGRASETLHLPALMSLGERVKIVAIADPDEHRCRRIAGMFDIANRFKSVDAMLRDAVPIDVVAVCTPAVGHADAAIAALEASKHVLIEKPLALTLDDAERIAAASAGKSELKLMVGFNLRHHRLIRLAKEMMTAGALGELQMIRTLWSSAATDPPEWRRRRSTGGGVLSEVAVHHFDLMRYLTGASIKSVFVQCSHSRSDDDTAAVVAHLDNGVTATSTFSQISSDANEVELIGNKGRISFSLYRFDSFTITPAEKVFDRAGNFKRNLRQFPQAWSILRRGGDFHETYRQEWQAFIEAIQSNKAPPVTMEDGIAALRAVLAAGASANRGTAVELISAPRAPEPVSFAGRAELPAKSEVNSESRGPKISAILATLGSFSNIARTFSHLRAQSVQNQIELVIVCPDRNQLGANEREIEGFAGWKIVEVPFNAIAQAYAAGTRAASAPVVVFCEDHAFPAPDWAESLLIAHRGPYAAVGPAVHNANPSTLVSRADMLMGYADWLEPIKPCEPHHLPGHNSSYKRDILLSYGDRLEEMLHAETVLQWELRSKGHRLYLDPTARIAHTNFAQFKIWASVQFHAGRVFAGARAKDWPNWKRAIYFCASPLIPLVRLKRMWKVSRRLDATHRLKPPLLLMLSYGLTIDGMGQMIGYAAGIGKSNRAAWEFCRIDHITDEDRRRLEAGQAAPSQAIQ